jgi:hypothetical protein
MCGIGHRTFSTTGGDVAHDVPPSRRINGPSLRDAHASRRRVLASTHGRDAGHAGLAHQPCDPLGGSRGRPHRGGARRAPCVGDSEVVDDLSDQLPPIAEPAQQPLTEHRRMRSRHPDIPSSGDIDATVSVSARPVEAQLRECRRDPFCRGVLADGWRHNERHRCPPRWRWTAPGGGARCWQRADRPGLVFATAARQQRQREASRRGIRPRRYRVSPI